MKKVRLKRKIMYLIIFIIIIITMFLSSRERNFMFIEKPIKELVNGVQEVLNLLRVNKGEEKFFDFTLSKEKELELSELKDLLDLRTIYSDFTITYASTINRNVSYWQELITLDKGEKDGIRKDMAVVIGSGLVGKITKTTDNYSEVGLLTATKDNYQVSVSVKSSGNSYYGILNKYDIRTDSYMVIGIPALANIEEGSVVITSGLGGIFPSGILVGTVIGSENDAYGISKTVKVKASSNFNKIRYVAVLKRKEG